MGKFWRLLLVLVVAIAARLLISLGQGDDSKGGDFEAQRHWMEITVNLPPSDWYVETDQNRLWWWGLDYPPLSAYWAWATGKAAQCIDPTWVALFDSRRNETPKLKWFMRASVILADCLVWIPALILYTKHRSYSWVMRLWVLLSPALLLIDHGHFQYNTIMLGLMGWAVVLLLDWKQPVLATSAVIASAGFKQMGLWAIPPFFFYLLRQCIHQRSFRLFLKLGLISIGTVLLIFWPYLHEFPNQAMPVLQRIFPLHRGLFEDKVANFWCAAVILTKFNQQWTQDQLVKLCGAVLGLVLLPSAISLLVSRPSANRFSYAFAYMTLSCFMFGYHVHEKNILVPLTAVLLLTHLTPVFAFWFSCLSALSLFQLMEKDKLELVYFALLTGWLLVSRRMYRYMRFSSGWRLLVIPTVLAMYALPLAQVFLTPPARYPHLFHVGAILGCSGGFLLSLVFLLYKQLTCDNRPPLFRNSI